MGRRRQGGHQKRPRRRRPGAGKTDIYHLGKSANIEHAQRNDPRKILFGNLGVSPVALRLSR